MTYRDGVKLISRLMSVYFLASAIESTLGIFTGAMTITTSYMHRSVVGLNSTRPYTYLMFQGIEFLVIGVLRVILWLLLAVVFYRCGPRIQRFFGCDVQEEISEPENGQ